LNVKSFAVRRSCRKMRQPRQHWAKRSARTCCSRTLTITNAGKWLRCMYSVRQVRTGQWKRRMESKISDNTFRASLDYCHSLAVFAQTHETIIHKLHEVIFPQTSVQSISKDSFVDQNVARSVWTVNWSAVALPRTMLSNAQLDWQYHELYIRHNAPMSVENGLSHTWYDVRIYTNFVEQPVLIPQHLSTQKT